MKRALSSLLVFALVLTLLVPAFAFAADKTTEQKFNELKEKGLLNGVEDGSAALDRELTRAELAAILVRLFKLEPITGQSTFIDVPATHWAQKEGVIEAVAKAGLMGSTTTYSKTFSPDAKLTIAEVAKVAVSALGLTVDQNAKIDGVQPWAAPYVDAALKAGLIAQAKDYHANANRGILVDAAYSIYLAKLQPPVTDATKVESVSAENLKEIVVKFDGKVDKDTATDVENYSLSKGTIKFATLSEDEETVILTTTSKMEQQKSLKLSVSNVKAGDKTISVKDYAFTPIDNTLPTVKDVVALGTKALKVVFNEPINVASASKNFKLDGKTFIGSGQADGTREIVLRPYDSDTLSVGEHTLTVYGVEDFAAFKSLSTDHKFTVVEDKDAPTIKEVKATLESVTIVFSEDIDNETVKASNVYWKSGSTKYAAKEFTKIAGDTYNFDFTGRALPAYETTLYVDGVKDYSGNALNPSSVLVKAELDQVRPAIKGDLELSSDNKSFTAKFTKALKPNQNFVKSFTVTDKDNKVVNIDTVKLSADGKSLQVYFYNALKEGTYTVKVSGIVDNTKLENMMLDETKELKVNLAPTISYSTFNAKDRVVEIRFSKEMNTATTTDPSKYLIFYKNAWRSVPSDTDFTVINSREGIRITFPSEIGSDDQVTLGKGSIEKLQIMNVTDLDGRVLKGNDDGSFNVLDFTGAVELKFAQQANYGNKEAVATDRKTIKVYFNEAVRASASDFAVEVDNATVAIESVSVSGKVVTIKLEEELTSTATNNIAVKAVEGNKIQTVLGIAFNEGKEKAVNGVYDLVSPEMKTLSVKQVSAAEAVYGEFGYIDITFTEDLAGDSTRYASDFVITDQAANSTLEADEDYITGFAVDNDGNILKNTVRIYLLVESKGATRYSVAIDGARFIKDADGNLALDGNKTTGSINTKR